MVLFFIAGIYVYPLFFIFFRVSQKKNGSVAFLSTAFIFIIAMIICRQLSVSGKSQMRFIIFRMDATAYGLVAAWVSTKINRLSNKKVLYLILSGLAAWLIAAIILESNINPFFKTVYYPVCGIGTAVFVLGLYYYSFKRKFSFVVQVSKISYSVYLTHLYLLLYPLAYWSKDFNNSLLVLVWLSSFGLIIVISSFTFKYIEQPFLRLRERLFPVSHM